MLGEIMEVISDLIEAILNVAWHYINPKIENKYLSIILQILACISIVAFIGLVAIAIMMIINKARKVFL
jgi:hypothetical protein